MLRDKQKPPAVATVGGFFVKAFGQAVPGFTSDRAENGGSRESERSVLLYVSTGSTENRHLQAGIT
jgi:hypothetical protein